jgi:ribosomal protein L37AE/L43A
MEIYEPECQHCGKRGFDVFNRMSCGITLCQWCYEDRGKCNYNPETNEYEDEATEED